MALLKRTLKGLIEYSDRRNDDGIYTEDDVIGVSTEKCMIPTKANLNGVNLLPYKLFEPRSFAFVADTSRRGDKMALAFNDTDRTFIVSTWYVVFQVPENAQNVLLPEYLYLYFCRPEFDRYARANSWGSAREYFWFSDMEDIEIELPPIEIQHKYVALYESIRNNQIAIETGMDDLRLACEANVERLLKESESLPIAPYVQECDARNGGEYGLEAVRGISVAKRFIPTKANMAGVNLDGYKRVKHGEIAFVTVTSRNSEKLTIAMNDSDETYIVSSTYIVFSTDTDKLLPEYLMLFFSRPKFDRYARFNSWGSARETFNWEDMRDVQIPIPSIDVQRSIANVYTAYNNRKRIAETLSVFLKGICPVLIKGSIDEARR